MTPLEARDRAKRIWPGIPEEKLRLDVSRWKGPNQEDREHWYIYGGIQEHHFDENGHVSCHSYCEESELEYCV